MSSLPLPRERSPTLRLSNPAQVERSSELRDQHTSSSLGVTTRARNLAAPGGLPTSPSKSRSYSKPCNSSTPDQSQPLPRHSERPDVLDWLDSHSNSRPRSQDKVSFRPSTYNPQRGYGRSLFWCLLPSSSCCGEVSDHDECTRCVNEVKDSLGSSRTGTHKTADTLSTALTSNGLSTPSTQRFF